MKTKAFILANIALFGLGVSSATAEERAAARLITSPRPSLPKMRVPARPPVQPAAARDRRQARQANTRPPASWDSRLKAGQRLPKTCAAKPKASRPPTSNEQPAQPRSLSLHFRQAAPSIVRVRSTSRAKRANAWKRYERPSSISALAKRFAFELGGLKVCIAKPKQFDHGAGFALSKLASSTEGRRSIGARLEALSCQVRGWHQPDLLRCPLSCRYQRISGRSRIGQKSTRLTEADMGDRV